MRIPAKRCVDPCHIRPNRLKQRGSGRCPWSRSRSYSTPPAHDGPITPEHGLPIKSEIRLTEPRRDNEQTIEYHFSDYKDFDGLKLCSKITIKLDDQHEFRLELGELKAVNKVPDDQFDMP